MKLSHKALLSLFAPTIAGVGVWTALPSQAQDDLTVTIGPVTDRAGRKPKMTLKERREYEAAIKRTAQMVFDSKAQSMARRHGLDVLNLTWEDTGRYKGSAVGPNISDMTIQVGVEDPNSGNIAVTAMPVIRFPNFSDLTCDLDPEFFTILVGNEKGKPLQRLSLYDYLERTDLFMSKPSSWKSAKRSLLADRDAKVLVSAQACFLPVPKQSKATFNPVVFNYQSYSNNPAVLTILATREGTSMTIIDNKRDAFDSGSMWGQRLFHNENGMRASLTGERLSDYKAANPGKTTASSPGKEAGLNMVLLIQVPLKQKERPRPMMSPAPAGEGAMYKDSDMAATRSNVENAVIGHGDIEGPYTEVDNLAIERDPRFPIRVTVQFYKATSNGVVSEADIQQIKQQIDRIYAMSDSVGSLVTDGETGRATEYYGSKVQPLAWWQEFWRRHEQNTGDSRAEAIAKLQKLLGKNYREKPVCALYLNDLLRK